MWGNRRFPFNMINTRKRTRAGSRIFGSPNCPYMGNSPVLVSSVDSAGNERPQKVKRGSLDSLGDWDDFEYKLFLEHLRIDGKSYVLEIVVGDERKHFSLKYEGVNHPHSSDAGQSQSHRSCGIMSSKVIPYKPKKKSKKENSSFCSPSIDEQYKLFLDNVRVCGNLMIVELENNITIKYEGGVGEDEGLPTYTEDLMEDTRYYSTEEELQPDYRYPQPSNRSECVHGRSPTMGFGIDSFMNRLMDILGKPYDQKEYDEMMTVATVRRPMLKWKHLRLGSIAYQTKEIGLSYFDYYPDLAKQIKISDCYRRLTLLRGFFHWLQNVGHDDAFRPWVSASSATRQSHPVVTTMVQLQTEMSNE